MASEEVEEVKTYSEIVVSLREELQRYMEREAEKFSQDMETVDVESLKPLRVDPARPRSFRKIAAVDGGSGILSFADREVGFIAAIAVIDDGRRHVRKIARPKILTQRYGEDEGDFSDRLDVERETLLIEVARKISNLDLLMVDGPLIPRPKYVGEYLLQLRSLIEESEKDNRLLVGFVKRPQSRFLVAEEFGGKGFYDRTILSALLEKGEAYPWPPRIRELKSVPAAKYTYLRLMDPPSPSVFRLDFPAYLDDERIHDILSYILRTSDPVVGVPALLMKADEEVKISKRLVVELYRECFENLVGRFDPKLWSPLAPKWGERIW